MENKEQQLKEEIEKLEDEVTKSYGKEILSERFFKVELLKAELKSYQIAKQEFIEKIDKWFNDNQPTKGSDYLDNELFILATESKIKELKKSLEEK